MIGPTGPAVQIEAPYIVSEIVIGIVFNSVKYNTLQHQKEIRFRSSTEAYLVWKLS